MCCCGVCWSSGETGLVDRWGFIMFTQVCSSSHRPVEYQLRWLLSPFAAAAAAAAASTESRLVKKLSCSRCYVTQKSVGILMESGPHASVCVLWDRSDDSRSLPRKAPWTCSVTFRVSRLFVRNTAEALRKTETDQSELRDVWSVKPDLDCIPLNHSNVDLKGSVK